MSILVSKKDSAKITRIQRNSFYFPIEKEKDENRWNFNKKRHSRFTHFYNRETKTRGGLLIE